jgi:hypothetical protein
MELIFLNENFGTEIIYRYFSKLFTLELIFLNENILKEKCNGSSVKFLSVKCTQTIKNAIMSADNFSCNFEFSSAFKNEFRSARRYVIFF